ncbi:hypothetical protein E1301_Tti021843 [Triplophysa tibetana]|uniref:Uncharacterized protein n=1 Tax=Triplophysa tibetana TaxID=1572043 RepID=A0A5A9NAQ9_9TELE|nr:hypothetical protein E1301_Tti021843 [Triplophysa tibetana]
MTIRLTVMKCVFGFASGIISTDSVPPEIQIPFSVPVYPSVHSLPPLTTAARLNTSWLCVFVCSGAPVRVTPSPNLHLQRPSDGCLYASNSLRNKSEVERKRCVRALERGNQKGGEHAGTWKRAALKPQCARPGASPAPMRVAESCRRGGGSNQRDV